MNYSIPIYKPSITELEKKYVNPPHPENPLISKEEYELLDKDFQQAIDIKIKELEDLSKYDMLGQIQQFQQLEIEE